jgi:hypothetical protein
VGGLRTSQPVDKGLAATRSPVRQERGQAGVKHLRKMAAHVENSQASKGALESLLTSVGNRPKPTEPFRQAGGHWFEPSTAHVPKAPLRRGFFDCAGGASEWATPRSQAPSGPARRSWRPASQALLMLFRAELAAFRVPGGNMRGQEGPGHNGQPSVTGRRRAVGFRCSDVVHTPPGVCKTCLMPPAPGDDVAQ